MLRRVSLSLLLPLVAVCLLSACDGEKVDYYDSDLYDIDWIWKAGASTTGTSGVYGSLGVAAPANHPGARDGAVTWRDDVDNFWLFGGHGVDGSGTTGELNDLWKYNGTQWAWMGGDSVANTDGTYGTVTVEDAANRPGGRSYAVSWKDSSGDVWVFGGAGYDDVGTTLGELNDLWKFSKLTNRWTWMGGSTAANASGAFVGLQGVADAGNWPGARHDGAGWVDTTNTLWLVAGTGRDSLGATGLLNDLWKYSPLTGQWTWVRGDATKDAPATYGTQATPGPNNTPSGRKGMAVWFVDAPTVTVTTTTAGDIGVPAVQSVLVKAVGGTFTLTLDAQVSGAITWSSSDSTFATNVQTALDAALGAGVVTVAAGATDTVVITFVADGAKSLFTADVAGLTPGKAWMYGGESLKDGNRVVLNELWQFNGTEWAWVSGGQGLFVAPDYSVRGAVTLLGTPGSRYRPTAWTTTEAGATTSTFWLFGGDVEAVSGTVTNPNDLWRYDSGYWTWEGGKNYDNPAGTYVGLGAQGQPGGRTGAAPWVDAASKTLWLFGGDNHADLWFYVYSP